MVPNPHPTVAPHVRSSRGSQISFPDFFRITLELNQLKIKVKGMRNSTKSDFILVLFAVF